MSAFMLKLIKPTCSFLSYHLHLIADERTASGTDAAISTSRSTTVRVSWHSRRLATRNLVFLSTSVTRQLAMSEPTTRSPSQCPGTARSSASAGRSDISQPSTQDLPRGRGGSALRGLRL